MHHLLASVKLIVLWEISNCSKQYFGILLCFLNYNSKNSIVMFEMNKDVVNVLWITRCLICKRELGRQNKRIIYKYSERSIVKDTWFINLQSFHLHILYASWMHSFYITMFYYNNKAKSRCGSSTAVQNQ